MKGLSCGLFLCLSVMLCAPSVWANYAFVQGKYGTPTSGTGIIFDSSNTAGNMIIAAASCDSSSGALTASDLQGNTYVTAKTQTNGGSKAINLAVAYNIAGGAANVVTFTISGGCGVSTALDAVIAEYSGLQSTDKTAGNSGSGANPSSGNTATTTSANEMVVGFAANSSETPAAGSGFTSRASGANNRFVRLEDKRVTSTGAYSGDFTTSAGAWEALVVTIAEPSTATTPPSPRLMLGVGPK